MYALTSTVKQATSEAPASRKGQGLSGGEIYNVDEQQFTENKEFNYYISVH